tara:strand:+ start:332 stop:580 length:249 start_codon:yes stop_codon:yes gene_type:complete
MAQIILYPAGETTVKTVFTPNTNITIDFIENKYNLNINFSEGDTISNSQELYIENQFSIDKCETINGVQEFDANVIVQYTEI